MISSEAFPETLARFPISSATTAKPLPFSPALDHYKVSSIQMGIFGQKKFREFTLDHLPFVAPITEVQGTPTKAKGLDGWPDDIFPRNIILTVSLLESALALTRKGHAVGYFPRFIVEQHNEIMAQKYHLFEIQMPKKIQKQQDIYLIKRKDTEEDINMKKLSKILRCLKSK